MTSVRPDGALTVFPDAIDLRRLQELYPFVDGDEVARFLDGSPFLAPLLLDAEQAAHRHFPKANLRLEVTTDPEAPEATHLVLSIASAGSVNRALTRLRRFDDEWWIDQIHRARGKLVITLTFGRASIGPTI